MRIFLLSALTALTFSTLAQTKVNEAPDHRNCAAHEKHVQMMGMDAAYAKRHADIEQHTLSLIHI